MSKSLKIILAILGIAGVASAGYYLFKSKVGKEMLRYVPNTAYIAIQIDLPAIGKIMQENSAALNEVKFLKDPSLAKTNPGMKVFQSILKNPENAGIDFSVPAMFYQESLLRGTASGILIKLNDKNKFHETIKNHMPAGNETGMQNNVQFVEFDPGVYVAWNEEVAMLSDQRTEGKTYFENILNHKNPTAEGNLLIKKATEGKGIISGIVRIDEMMASNALKPRMEMGMNDMKNPLPAGTAIEFNVMLENSKLRYDIGLISTDKKKLNEINFFKKKGNFDQYSKSLFSQKIPYLALSLSVDPDKFISFLSKINTTINEKEIPQIGEIKKIWNGDLVIGISMQLGDTENEMVWDENPFDVIVHIGTQNTPKPMLDEYLGQTHNPQSGTYRIPFGDFNMGILKNEIVVSNNLESIKSIIAGNFKSSYDGKLIKSKHSSSPLFGAANPEAMANMKSMFTLGSSSSKTKDIFESVESSYYWIDDSKMISEIEFKPHKDPIIVRMLQGMDAYFEADKKQKLEFEEALENNSNDPETIQDNAFENRPLYK